MINEFVNAHVCKLSRCVSMYMYSDLRNEKMYYCVQSVIEFSQMNHVLRRAGFNRMHNSIVATILIFMLNTYLVILFELFVM